MKDRLRLPHVRGKCPACGNHALFLGNGGRVTCSIAECPSPAAADFILDGDPNQTPSPAPLAIRRTATPIRDASDATRDQGSQIAGEPPLGRAPLDAFRVPRSRVTAGDILEHRTGYLYTLTDEGAAALRSLGMDDPILVYRVAP